MSNLEYIGKAESSKTTYHVFQSDKDYVVCSYKDTNYRTGYFNVVAVEWVDQLHQLFANTKGITVKEIRKHPKIKKSAQPFDVHLALYVLVARKRAKIYKKRLGKQLQFRVLRRIG